MKIITRALAATKLAAKANAPTILVAAGIGSMAVGTVLACKQTLKLEETLTPHADNLERAGTNRSARNKVILQAALDLTRLYAVPCALFAGGGALVFKGHNVLLKRNATLAVAFTGLQKSFEAYRARVVDQFGEEVDAGMLNGHKTIDVVDPETDAVQSIHTRDWDAARLDMYNRVFEQGASTMWEPDLAVNKMFLDQQRRFAQQRLNLQGYLYLSDVYEALGFPETDISRVTGWKVRTLEDGTREIPEISFGLDKVISDDWKYNREKAVYLDFNVQGLIVGGKVQTILEKG